MLRHYAFKYFPTKCFIEMRMPTCCFPMLPPESGLLKLPTPTDAKPRLQWWNGLGRPRLSPGQCDSVGADLHP